MCCLRKESAVFTDLEKKKIVAQCLITIHGASVNINPGA